MWPWASQSDVETLPSVGWRPEWTALLDERDRLSCLQGVGPRGPPFSSAGRPFWYAHVTRWFPWNWFSIDGTGWCFDASWDEMRRCSEVEISVDWNGVSSAVRGDEIDVEQLPVLQLLALACLAYALAAHLAYRQWARRRARRLADAEDGERTPDDGAEGAAQIEEPAASLLSWLQSGEAPPWHWHGSAQLALLSASLGLVMAASIPLPPPPPVFEDDVDVS